VLQRRPNHGRALPRHRPPYAESSTSPRNNCMHAATTDLPPPVNHVFVDFENVHEIDLAIIGSKAVHFTLLLGSRQTKLAVSLVEKLLEHAASVQLVRLTSAGKNALDFTLAYYVGRAVAADPTGHLHIVSRDAGYDPLIEHLRSKHIRAHRHDSFATLTFVTPTEIPTPPPHATALKSKPPSKPKVRLSILDERETQVLEHLRKATTTRPRNEKKLLSYLVAHLGHKITESEGLNLVQSLSQAGHLTIGEKGAVTYHLDSK
jgi:hypothetical protein